MPGVLLRSVLCHCAQRVSQVSDDPAVAQKTVVNSQGTFATPQINVIPKSRWEKGIPPVMGGHLMASGAIAPHSTSGGVGEGAQHQFQYKAGDADVNVLTFADKKKLAENMAKLIAKQQEAILKKKDVFNIVLSGGSLINMLPTLLNMKQRFNFSKWHVYWADERNVPYSSPDSTIGETQRAFLSQLDIPESQIHGIMENVGVEQAATAYEADLLRLKNDGTLAVNDAGYPVFDMVLLGIGPDGHIASLFPNHPLLAVTDKWVAPISDSPKPPPERITLTLPVINAATCVAFVAAGANKVDVVERILEEQSLPGALPAQLVRPEQGSLYWLLDVEAGAKLNFMDWDDAKMFPRNVH